MERKFKLKNWITTTICIMSVSSMCAQAQKTPTLATSTQQLVQLSTENSSAKQISANDLGAGIQAAKARRAFLINMMKKNAGSVYKYLLTSKIASNLPNSIMPFVENEVTNIKGLIEIRASTNLQQDENTEYLVTADDGTIYYLYFSDSVPKDLKSGQTVKINHGFDLVDDNGYHRVALSANDLVITKNLTAEAKPDAFGAQTTLVFLVNFQDAPTNQPFTPAQVNTMTFTNVSNMYMEASFQQSSLTGNVVGWYTIPLSSTSSCDTITNNLPGLAEQAAVNAGVNITPYIHRVYLFPNVASCGWAGLGTIGRTGGGYSRAWLNGYNDLRITGHEIGHNMGVQHSHSLECNGTSNTGSCTRNEYGDYADIMGFGDGAHFNAMQKEILGWLNYNISPPIQTVSSAGTYTIDPYEIKNQNVKALKVLKRAGTTQYYYLEYRQPIGFDSVLNCSGCDFTKGVLIHQGDTSDINSIELLDMSPTDTNKRNVIALLPGQSFEDTAAPNGGVKFTVNSVSATQANVTVTYGSTPPPPQCVRANPTLNISPNYTQYVSTGGSASYVLTVKNNDSSTCAANSFGLSTTAQPRIKATLSTQSLSLTPGQTSNANLTITASKAALPALYKIGITAVNAADPTKKATVLAGFGIK